MKNKIDALCRKYARWVPALFILFTLLLLLLTLAPDYFFDNRLPGGSDKLSHSFFFGIWTILFWLSLKIRNPHEQPSLILVFFAASCLGIIIELLQYFIPFDRDIELYDIAANTLGIIIAVVWLYVVNMPNMETQ